MFIVFIIELSSWLTFDAFGLKFNATGVTR